MRHHAIRLTRVVGPVTALYILKIVIALGIFVFSSRWLDDKTFIAFNQLFLLFSLLNLVSAAGTVSGLVSVVAGAGDDTTAVASGLRSALVIWSCTHVLLIATALLLADAILRALTIENAPSWLIPSLAVFAMLSGLGQILCATLVGKMKIAVNVALQSAGTVAGGCGSLYFIGSGQYVPAIVCYAFGTAVVAPLAAWWLQKELKCVRSVSADHLGTMARYSACFIYTAALTPIAFFGVRYAYELRLGEAALRDLITAMRLSDVNTQFVGMMMAQLLLPRIAANPDAAYAQSVVKKFGAFAGLCMAGSLCAYLLLHEHVAFILPLATGGTGVVVIALFLLGDVLRVPQSMGLTLALAEGRLAAFASIETAGVVLMLAIFVATIQADMVVGAALAYACGYAASGCVAMLLWFKSHAVGNRTDKA